MFFKKYSLILLPKIDGIMFISCLYNNLMEEVLRTSKWDCFSYLLFCV